jgi:PBSX family phage terminase large subunit
MAKFVTPRDKPKYGDGTFKQPKVKRMIDYVLSREGWIVEVEGGKRGSKDVTAIYAWAQFLMVTPDKEHLVLGRTLEHAIVTVLKSQGFGLYYCIPSGEFTRESISGGATRGVFKFTDAYGVEKIVYFYGNEKAQDYAKFKGFSLGSVYINEANEQHINGIREAKERTNASMRPRVIITQNPKSASHVYYTEFEKPLIYDEEENLLIREIKRRFSDDFEAKKAEMLEEMELERKQLVSAFLQRRSVRSSKLLPKTEFTKLTHRVRDLKESWNKRIRSLQVKDFTDEYTDSTNKLFSKLNSASMELVMNYVDYYDNPNEVKNGLEFAYFHFTHDDNPAMSDADRSRIDRTYDTTSPTYLRDIRGLRATVDNAIWATFNDNNVYNYDIPYDAIKTRVFGADLGYDHPFAVVEALILHDNTVMINDELFVIPSREREKANNVEYIKLLKAFIEKDYDGEYSSVRIDPSAKGFINQALSNEIIAVKAKNRVRNYKPGETTESDHSEDRKLAGINLVREGFRLGKIKVHKRCENLIKQIQGYAFDNKKLSLGVEAPIKINDDLNDALRYVINSEIGYVSRWDEGSETLEYVEEGQEKVLGDHVSETAEDTVDFQQSVVKSIIQAFKGHSNSGHLF